MVSVFPSLSLLHSHYILEEPSAQRLQRTQRPHRTGTTQKQSHTQITEVPTTTLRNDDYFMGTTHIEQLLGTSYYEVIHLHFPFLTPILLFRTIATPKGEEETIDSTIATITQTGTNTQKRSKYKHIQQTHTLQSS